MFFPHSYQEELGWGKGEEKKMSKEKKKGNHIYWSPTVFRDLAGIMRVPWRTTL